MDDEFKSIQSELRMAPTVEAGLINLLVRVRWQIEAHAGDEEKMRELAHTLDTQSAELADAVLKNTPAETASIERAASIQAEADTENGS